MKRKQGSPKKANFMCLIIITSIGVLPEMERGRAWAAVAGGRKRKGRGQKQRLLGRHLGKYRKSIRHQHLVKA